MDLWFYTEGSKNKPVIFFWMTVENNKCHQFCQFPDATVSLLTAIGLYFAPTLAAEHR